MIFIPPSQLFLELLISSLHFFSYLYDYREQLRIAALLLFSCLFLLCFEQALFLQLWGRALVALSSLQTPPHPHPPALSSVSGSSSTAGVASLGSSIAALFLSLALSTSSPYAGVLRTPVRVRGEALRHISSISLNVHPL